MTGFVPLNCYHLISYKEITLEEALDVTMKEIIGEVCESVVRFRNQLTTDQFKGKFDEFLRQSFRSQLYDKWSSMRALKDYCHCWDLKLISCEIEEIRNNIYLSRPRALSTAIAIGMMKVFSCWFDFKNMI